MSSYCIRVGSPVISVAFVKRLAFRRRQSLSGGSQTIVGYVAGVKISLRGVQVRTRCPMLNRSCSQSAQHGPFRPRPPAVGTRTVGAAAQARRSSSSDSPAVPKGVGTLQHSLQSSVNLRRHSASLMIQIEVITPTFPWLWRTNNPLDRQPG